MKLWLFETVFRLVTILLDRAESANMADVSFDAVVKD